MTTPAPSLTPAQQSALNEDWSKVASWDVRDAKGDPVADLDTLAKILGVDRTEAAHELLANPASAAAPAALVAEAKSEVLPDPDQASVLDGWVEDSDGADTDDEDAADGGADDDVEGKAFPWQKGGKKAGSGLKAGSWVSGNFGVGKIDLVVSTGKVPGVDSDVEGTKDKPAARVRVYEDGKATDKRVAAKLSGLKSTFPQKPKAQKKSGSAGLVLLVADAAGRLGPVDNPGPEAIRTAYERGQASWPGETKTLLSAEEWALGRAQAFVDKCAGYDTPGYIGDDDLLP